MAGKKPDDFVFTRGNPKQLRDFRKTWANVCVAAGVGTFHCPTCDEVVAVDSRAPYMHCGVELGRSDLKYRGLIFHDLRRCAVRGLTRAGVPQKTAMSITGHKTISVFNRYHIVSPADRQEATRKLEISQKLEREALEKSQATEFGQSLGRVARKQVQTIDSRIAVAAPPVLPN